MIKAKKFFNTAGPVDQAEHYKIDPLKRWDLEEILELIQQKKYFILHAPRQTGKTSCLLALRDYLTKQEDYYCVYANFESAQTARNNIQDGMRALLSEINSHVKNTLALTLPFSVNEIITETGHNTSFNAYLERLCRILDKPLILLIDEIDALIGDTLVSVLRQLRSGYTQRPEGFPQSVILCGVRDIKDYRIHRSDDDIITGGSCFNIKAESLTLGNFSIEEVKELYNEHTKETRQKLEERVFPLVMNYTGGQPWLVNALAYQVINKMGLGKTPDITLTVEHFEQAKEQLVVSRYTHLDQLADKLKEERVRRVIEPLLVGEVDNSAEDDNQYCLDLGLVKLTPEGLTIANDIYREIIPRELTQIRQTRMMAVFRPEWIDDNGSLNTEKLFSMFQQFWRENSDIWKDDMAGYKEAAPHLTFQAFLQRVANGSGIIERKFAYGTRRADLMLKWRYSKNEQRVEQRIVIELKMLTERDTYEKVKEIALEQTANYADISDADEAHVIIFDRTGKTGWKEKVFTDSGEVNGYNIKIWCM